MLLPRTTQPLAHEPRGAGMGHDPGVRGEVVAVRVRDKSEGLARLRIEPERVLGKVQSAVVAEGNHGSNKMVPEGV
jgi:hypothetical protein